MSDAKNKPLDELLSGFSLGPSWAKGNQDGKSKSSEGRLMSRPQADKRDYTDRRDDRGPRIPGRNRRDERPAPAPREEIRPAPGVSVTIIPAPEAVHLIGKEIMHEARVYPLFDVAQTLLAERVRCRAIFESPDPQPFLWRGLLDESLFLTREEAAQHLWSSALRGRFLEEETIDTEPPKGNYTAVARCGLSGEWLGPPNFHAYQSKLRRVHRERYAHMSLEAYASKVRMEKGEEAVNAWLATMTQKTRWRIRGAGDDAWMDEEAIAKRELALRFLDEAFEEARCIEVNASIPADHISPSLMLSMKLAGGHAKEHPAFLIPAVCKALEAEHLPVFKRKGKLFTGPARPHPLPPGQLLAERPGIIVEWIRNNTPAKLEGLWQAVSPEGSTAPPAEFAADLYWLLQQGHILLYLDDTLSVQEVRSAENQPTPEGSPTGKKKKKRKKKPGADPAASAAAESQTDDSSPADGEEEESRADDADENSAPDPDTNAEPDSLPVAVVEDAPPATVESTPEEPRQPELSEEIPPSTSPGVDESRDV